MTIWRMRIACRIPKATNTLRLCSTHCSSTAVMVARTRLSTALYVHCRSCWVLDLQQTQKYSIWRNCNVTRYEVLRATMLRIQFLGELAQSRKVRFSFVSIPLCRQVSARFPLDGFKWNLILRTFMKIYQKKNPILVKIVQRYLALSMKT